MTPALKKIVRTLSFCSAVGLLPILLFPLVAAFGGGVGRRGKGRFKLEGHRGSTHSQEN